MNKGQGLVEYALILVLIAVIIIVVVSLLGSAINSPCHDYKDTSFVCRDYQLQQCIKSEKYSEEECMALVGGK